MATTESARSVDGGKHTHEFVPTPDAGSVTTTSFASSVYAATGTIAGASPDDTANGGLATTIARGDHRHAAPCAAPGNIAPDDAAAEGNSTSFARANHVHGITCGTPAALTKTATAAESAGTGFARDTHVHATSALPWGIVDRDVFTADSSGYATGATTDFSLTVTADNTRAYVIYLASQITVSGAGGAWSAELNEAGTPVGRFFRYVFAAGVSETPPMRPVLWLPASSGSVTVDVRLTGAGGGTLTFIGAAANPRQFWIEDIGPR